MVKPNMNEDDPLEDFDRRTVTLEEVTKVVHVAGSGPAVIVMTEMPGISPHVARFSRWVRDAGFTVYMPSLFGRDGAVPTVEEGIALPLDDPAGLEIAPDELTAVRERLEREDLTVMAYRFEGDRFCKAERFAAYSQALGDRFIGRVLPDSAANPDTAPFFEQVVASPHSVVTAHLIDEAGQPTIAARDEILSFFAERLAS